MKKVESLTSARQWLTEVSRSTRLGLVDRAQAIVRDTKHYALREVNIRRYLSTPGPKKLQVGTGANILDGWLNADVSPFDRRVAYLDATQRFPFADGSFDAVFSEHMIEHIDYPQGRHMLRECFRILKPGGEIRIVTPDLRALLDLYAESRTPVQDQYIQWMTDMFWPSVGQYAPVFVVNYAMRFAGHKFFYDAETLEALMTEAGFQPVERCDPGYSSRPVFDGVDSHARYIGSDEMNAYEAMAFEAAKPRSSSDEH